MIEALIPLAIEGTKAGIGFFQAKNASKKAANASRDYGEKTQQLTQTFNDNISIYGKYFTQADTPFLQSVLDSLQGKLDQNPYALDGLAGFSSTYSPEFKGQSIDLFNYQIKTAFESYIDQKKASPAVQGLSVEGTVQTPQGSQQGISVSSTGLPFPTASAAQPEAFNPVIKEDFVLPAGILVTGLIAFVLLQRR